MFLWGKDFKISKEKAHEELDAAETTGMLQLGVCLLRHGRCGCVGGNSELEKRMEGWVMHEGEKAVGVTGAAG